MELRDPIRSVLKHKGGNVWTVPPGISVFHAIAIMSEKQVGALLVMQDAKLVGILSERDYARKIILKGRSSKDTPVGEIMTSPVTVCNSAGDGGRVHEDHDREPRAPPAGGRG